MKEPPLNGHLDKIDDVYLCKDHEILLTEAGSL